MSLYVTLPHLNVQRANAFAGAGILSLTPVMAASMMGEAFAFHFDVEVKGVMLIHHDAYLLAESELTAYDSHKFYLQKLQGASLFNLMDVNSKNRSGDSAKPVHSDQPNAFMAGQWSIVLEIDDTGVLTAQELESAATQFIEGGARLAGGIIQTSGKPCAGYKLYGASGSAADRGVINHSIGNGFVTIDRSDHLIDDKQTRVERLLAAMATHSLDGGESKGWFSPAVLGYALISDPETKENVRENKPHAFCESAIGLTQLVSIRDLAGDDNCLPEGLFWSHDWTEQNIFLVSQRS